MSDRVAVAVGAVLGALLAAVGGYAWIVSGPRLRSRRSDPPPS